MAPFEIPTPPENEKYTDVLDQVRSLLIAEAEPLYGEEIEGKERVTGLRRSFTLHDETGNPTSIGLALYNQDARGRITALLRAGGVEVDNPIGHIEFTKTIGEAHLSGVLYLEESTNQIQGFVLGKKERNEASPENWACYELADALGITKYWTDLAAITEYGPGKPLYDERMTGRLLTFLTGLEDNV